MMAAPQHALLPDGRLHLHHGPIDLIIGVEGPERSACYRAAYVRFETVLGGLAIELADLRKPSQNHRFSDPIAQRMAQAIAPHRDAFVTPMAAVAGAVADEVLAAMVADHAPSKAYVNNGGDIAFHLNGKHSFAALGPTGEITITATDPARGIATSGWGGRSHSLGIADAVTVLARNAAAADVAATLIANAVDLPGHPAITRMPAHELNPDSDLGARLVTTDVGPLPVTDINDALSYGAIAAQNMIAEGHILQVILSLRHKTKVIHPALKGAVAHA